jgi:hypothetical protein
MVGELPPFSWSHSRALTLAECERKYYWHYYGYHNGWSRFADRESQLAWRLKHLTTYEMEIGRLVDGCAQEIALAVRDRRALPAFDVLHDRCRNALRDLYRRGRRLELFRDDPKRHPVTRDAYYAEPLDSASAERLRRRLATCLRNLLSHPLWEQLADAARRDVLEMQIFTDRPSFVFDSVVVYATPDFIFTTPETGWVIIDWKTGAMRDAGDQLAIYGLFLREGLGLPARDGGYGGHVVHLGTDGGDVAVALTSDALDRAAERVRDGVATMRALLADADRNIALDRARFALTSNRQKCRRCNFFELCEPELPPAPPLDRAQR